MNNLVPQMDANIDQMLVVVVCESKFRLTNELINRKKVALTGHKSDQDYLSFSSNVYNKVKVFNGNTHKLSDHISISVSFTITFSCTIKHHV